MLFTSLILVILGALANGPGARWLIHRTIQSELAKMGMEGDLVVEGRLLTGFSLLRGEFGGTSTEAAIQFEKLSVEYELLELLDKKVRRIEGRNIKVVTLATEKPEEEFVMPDFDAIGDIIRTVRELVRPVSVDFEQVHYRLVRPDQDAPLDIHLGTLKHPANSDAFAITGFQSNALGETGLPKQDIHLRWENDDLVLDQLQIFPDLSLSTAHINYEAGTPVELFTAVTALSSQLVAFADSTGTIEVDLKNDALDLGATAARFVPDLEISGSLAFLHLRADGLLGTPDSWEVVANVQGSDLKWQSGQLGILNADLILGERARLIADLGDGIKARLDLENPLHKIPSFDDPDWWKGVAGTAEVEIHSIHEAVRQGTAAAGQELPDLNYIPDGTLDLKADILTGGSFPVEVEKADWSLRSPTVSRHALPDLKGTASLTGSTAGLSMDLAQPREQERLSLTATYNLISTNYQGTLTTSLPDTDWIQPFLPADSPDWKPTGALAFEWQGQGSVKKETHAGDAEVSELTVTSPGEPGTTSAKLVAKYDWPKSVQLPSLSVHNGDFWLDGSIQWMDDRLSIPILRLHDATGQLAGIQGGLPLSPEKLGLDEILQQPGALDLSIQADELKLERLRKIFPLNLPEGLTATLHAALNLGGTLAKPTLGGQIRTTGVHLPSPETLPLLEAELNFETNNDVLQATGRVTEPAGQVLSLTGALPLNVGEWIDRPAALQELKLDATVKIDQLALSRLQVLEPSLANAEGSLNAEFKLSGTAADPKKNGSVQATLKRYPLPIPTFREIRNASLSVTLDDDRLTIEPSIVYIAGGKFTLSGDVALGAEEPAFNLSLKTDHALLWRNDSFIIRSNSNLQLDGTMSKARLSGSIELVESLFYKDIEIIPIGVPTTSAPEPKLPTIDKKKVASSFDIPAPFNAWTLDLVLRTDDDPVLIRGNLATGKITADVRIGGTLANPLPSGAFKIKGAEAALPFSKLTVEDGSLVFRPESPLDPVLDIRGNSTVNSHRVGLYVYGPVSDPKYTLSSDRGLPKAEILTLLATGTTTADLEDPEVAKSKAFQIFLDDLRRRANKPGGNRMFRNVLEELDEVDLKIGENDPFSGRKFNSATLQLGHRWYLSAAVDGAGNTRGLVIFSMRFQ